MRKLTNEEREAAKQRNNEYKKQWAKDNAEKVKEQKRACYLRNKERYNKESKERYERVKETEEYKE